MIDDVILFDEPDMLGFTSYFEFDKEQLVNIRDYKPVDFLRTIPLERTEAEYLVFSKSGETERIKADTASLALSQSKTKDPLKIINLEAITSSIIQPTHT